MFPTYCPHSSEDFSSKIFIFFHLLIHLCSYTTIFLNCYIYDLAAFLPLANDYQCWPCGLNFFICPHNEVPKTSVIIAVFQYTLQDMITPFFSPRKPFFLRNPSGLPSPRDHIFSYIPFAPLLECTDNVGNGFIFLLTHSTFWVNRGFVFRTLFWSVRLWCSLLDLVQQLLVLLSLS